MQGRPNQYKTIAEVDAKLHQLKSKKLFLEQEKQKFDMSIWHYSHRIEQLTERREELVAKAKINEKAAEKKRQREQENLQQMPAIKMHGQTNIEAFFKPRSQMQQAEQPRQGKRKLYK